MMLFIHTIDKVLSGEKCQTSRLWKDTYDITGWRDDGSPKLKPLEISGVNTATLGNTRKLYYLGQILSVQPNRGQKGIAKIRVLELARRDVRNFTFVDIEKEGFETHRDFYEVWAEMHDKPFSKMLECDVVNDGWWIPAIAVRPIELYTALVITFELVAES